MLSASQGSDDPDGERHRRSVGFPRATRNVAGPCSSMHQVNNHRTAEKNDDFESIRLKTNIFGSLSIHVVGAGGAGMNAIAAVLHDGPFSQW